MKQMLGYLFALALLVSCAAPLAVTKKESKPIVSRVPSKQDTVEPAHFEPPKRHGFCAKEDVERPIRRNLREIQACYEDELVLHPELSGRVDASWTLAKDGRVKEVVTTGLKELGACIAEVIRDIRFVPPNVGCEVVSRYPFVFGVR